MSNAKFLGVVTLISTPSISSVHYSGHDTVGLWGLCSYPPMMQGYEMIFIYTRSSQYAGNMKGSMH